VLIYIVLAATLSHRSALQQISASRWLTGLSMVGFCGEWQSAYFNVNGINASAISFSLLAESMAYLDEIQICGSPAAQPAPPMTVTQSNTVCSMLFSSSLEACCASGCIMCGGGACVSSAMECGIAPVPCSATDVSVCSMQSSLAACCSVGCFTCGSGACVNSNLSCGITMPCPDRCDAYSQMSGGSLSACCAAGCFMCGSGMCVSASSSCGYAMPCLTSVLPSGASPFETFTLTSSVAIPTAAMAATSRKTTTLMASPSTFTISIEAVTTKPENVSASSTSTTELANRSSRTSTTLVIGLAVALALAVAIIAIIVVAVAFWQCRQRAKPGTELQTVPQQPRLPEKTSDYGCGSNV
jgi:hypothetical protein